MTIKEKIVGAGNYIKDSFKLFSNLKKFENNSRIFYQALELKESKDIVVYGTKAIKSGQKVLYLEEKLGIKTNLPIRTALENIENPYLRCIYTNLFPGNSLMKLNLN